MAIEKIQNGQQREIDQITLEEVQNALNEYLPQKLGYESDLEKIEAYDSQQTNPKIRILDA